MQYIQFIKKSKFLRYATVGAIGTLIDVALVYYLVQYLNIGVLVATSVGFIVAATHNFLLNKLWTFSDTSRRILRQYIKFLVISLVGLTLSLICMSVLYTGLHLDIVIAKLITSGVVLIWNFSGNKIWTFHSGLQLKYIPTERKNSNIELSILIPAYNETKRIKKTIEHIETFLEDFKYTHEIIIVDDGSSDDTTAYIKKHFPNVQVFRLETNIGKGGAIAEGMKKVRGTYTLLYDADGSTPITELFKIFPLRKQYDFIIGSRYMQESIIEEKQSWLRILISRSGNFFINLILLEDIRDTQCGFKLLSTEKARSIFKIQKIQRWGYDIELLFLAEAFGFSVHEVPVAWKNDTFSKFRAIQDTFGTLQELFIIKFSAWFGLYK